MTTIAQYKGFNTEAGPSPALWADVELLELFRNANKGFEIWDDFFGYGDVSPLWNLTNFTSGTGAPTDGIGGLLALDAGATTADQGVQLQTQSEAFIAAAGRKIVFEARLHVTNTSNQFFAGLGEEDATVFSAGANTMANHCGFEMNAATIASDAGKLQFYGEKAGTRATIANVHTLVSADFVKIGFIVDGVTKITPYVNGVANTSTIATASIPIVEMTPTFVCIAEGTTQPVVTIDWVRVAQVGRGVN